jgi:multidrug efflux pump subunit AcrB
MNLFGMLSKMNFNGGAIISDNEWEKHKAFYNYMLHLYLIGIYVYSMYITRYSLTDKEFDILTNVDSQEIHSANHINNLLLQNYSNNMLSAFNAVYDKEEIEEATEDYKAYIKERRSENAAAAAAAKEARDAEMATNIEEYRKVNGKDAVIPPWI